VTVITEGRTQAYEEAAMSALTPDCDPDMNHCGQPWRGKSGPGATVVSVAVLLTLLGVSLAVVAGRAVSDAFDFVAVPVALFAGISLVRRVAHSAAPGVKALVSRIPTTVPVRRSQPVG
jgi:hypothetical protein